jgi:RNA polymerase sigma-70 factor (ECF subfamily)
MSEAHRVLMEHRQRLLAYLLHLVGDPHEAEDVLQEVSVATLENPAMLDRAGDVFAYLRGVARHLAAGRASGRRTGKCARFRAGEALRSWVEWAWEAGTGEADLEDERRRQLEALRACRGELGERARLVLGLRYDEGLSIEGVAARTKARAGAVKVALLRVRRALAGCVRRRLSQGV